MRHVLSVDIGSTYTKAALLDLDAPAVLRREQRPTTQQDLSLGFERVVHVLADSDIPIHLCSSAKGGLAIAAIGVVPDLTASVARLAAASAGGRITAHYSYGLTGVQVAELEVLRPDILLLCGGTDGGHERLVLKNAHAIASSALSSTILYAGNASLQEEMREIFRGRILVVTENVMPEIGRLNIEPARAAIRAIFLERIIEGHGLAKAAQMCAAAPKPTPLAVYQLAEALNAVPAGWEDTLLIDMGGATTDVYSLCRAFRGEEGMVLRGIEEPALKRTVEGDLGMRVSARAAADTGSVYIQRRLREAAVAPASFAAWIERVAALPETLPGFPEEQLFDEILAEACLYHALLRHAGTAEEVWTPGGKVRVQHGKDLRDVQRIVASGGWLARFSSPAPVLCALAEAGRDSAGASLLPHAPSVLADRHYLLPLLGNLAAEYPVEIAALARANLAMETIHAG